MIYGSRDPSTTPIMPVDEQALYLKKELEATRRQSEVMGMRETTTAPAIGVQLNRLSEYIGRLDDTTREMIHRLSPVMLPLEQMESRIPSQPRPPECALATALGEMSARIETLTAFINEANKAIQL